jgi:hypothetical protein
MASENASVFRGASSHPLSSLRNIIDKHELEHFWPEFEAKLPDLFITEASNCEVEIIEIVSSSNFSPPRAVKGERIGSEGEGNLVERISSVEELDTVLHVRGLTSKAKFVFSNSNNLIIHSENYCRVLQGYCRRLFQ